MVTMTHQTREESYNMGQHHDNDGTINKYDKEHVLGYDGVFDEFDYNDDVTSDADQAYEVHSTIMSPGSWVLDLTGNLCAQKFNKA